MVSLHKMAICGIRSFGCEEGDAQVVRFQKPLTLILGENGCGKSTIIECLRYVTTQKDPGAKGTFIHDPTLANKTTVKGYVKLKVIDSKNCEIDVAKHVQATKTKKSITTKNFDNVITRTDKDTNQKKSISSRCADFGYEIPRIFGVSRAILENVIFCTQEDSHWPLETDQKLKEKFDQIFDSDRYNKCVNKVRDKRKRLKEDLKNVETELKYLKENKVAALDKKRRLERTKAQKDECTQQIEQYNADLIPIENRLKEIVEAQANIAKLVARKESKETELKNIENYQKDLKKRIGTEFNGTDEELKETINNFHAQLLENQKGLAKLEGEIDMYGKQENKLSKDMMTEQTKLGHLQKEEEVLKEHINDRNRRLNKLASDLGIEASTQSQFAEEDFQVLMGKVKEKIKNKEDEYGDLRKEKEKEEHEFQTKIDELREETMTIQNDVTNKEKSVKEGQQEMTKIKRQLNELDQSASKLQRIESQISKINRNIEDLQTAVNIDDMKDKLKNLISERNRLEERLVEIEDDVKIMQQKASVSAELDVQLEAKANKSADIRRLLNKHDEKLKKILGSVPRSGFKISLQNHVDQLRRRVKELQSTQSRKEKELTELEINRKHVKENLNKKEQTLRNSEDEVYEECSSGDFEDTLNQTQKEVDNLQERKGILSSSQYMYKKYIEQLEKTNPCCPLCHRNFDREDDATTLIDELTSRIREVPTSLAQNKTQLEEKQTKYNKLLTLKPTNERISILRNVEIPGLRSDLEKIETNLKKVKKELEDISTQIVSPQTDESECSAMQGDMALLDQLQSEERKLEREIERLQTKLGSGGSAKGNLEEMLKEQDTVRTNLRATRDSAEKLQTKINQHSEELQTLQATKNSLMEEMNRIQGGVGQRKQLEDRYADLQGLEIIQMEEADQLKENLANAKKKLNDALSHKQSLRSKNLDLIEKARQSLSVLQKQYEDIEKTQRLIKATEERNISRRLENLQNALRNLETQLEQLRAKKSDGIKRVNEIKRDLSNQEVRERELQDNLTYREKIVEAEKTKKEIAELEEKFGNFNANDLSKEKHKLMSEEENIRQEKALRQGRLGEIRSQIEQLEKELNSKLYRSAEEDFSKQFLRAELLKTIGTDLDRYATTMEYAMVKYHQQQMKKVNSFIREYWRKIYQGNDIDYIEIQTDNTETTGVRRNYNYRLVQVKSDVCLDMRNRCSAGQKMLASLIIRMALAETFSSNCGILTLDEPTTNLDRKNIKNLARTLNEVLLAKQAAGFNNFQLIVITHDEEFVQELMEVDAISEYVKIERNLRGKTRVVREKVDGRGPVIAQSSRRPQLQHQYDYD